MPLALGAQLGVPGGQGTVFRAVPADGDPVAAKVFLQRTQHCLQPEHDMLVQAGAGGHQNIIRCLGIETVQLPNPRPPNPPKRHTEDPYANPCLKLALANGDLFDRAFCSGDSLTIAGLHL